jgi:hypothetical protein
MRQHDQKFMSAASHRDPISGEPDAHPVGVGIGAVGVGSAACAVGGMAAGPVGAAVGAVVGALAGGYAGRRIAESIDREAMATIEDAYWREHYYTRPYYVTGTLYEEYRPAYQYGWEARTRYNRQTFEEVEPELERGWPEARGDSGLGWETARFAARDAWDRVDEALVCGTHMHTDTDTNEILL